MIGYNFTYISPELQSSSGLRDICFALYQQLKNDENPQVVIEAIKCIQNFIMFARKYVDIPSLIPFLQIQINGNISVIRKASVTCLYQLTQRDPNSVLEADINHQLEEQLFSLLDIEMDPMIRAEIKDILNALLRHVSSDSPSRWIDLCKNILAKTSATTKIAAATGKTPDYCEEENVEAPAVLSAPKPADFQSQKSAVIVLLLPRWRTQVFAIQCLCTLVKLALETNLIEHRDLEKARKKRVELGDDTSKSDFLIFRISDLIRLAFNSSTANVSDLRASGLVLLKEILYNFMNSADPDFEGHSLLEQYEAQIISALAPAFAPESHPAITSSACKVCAYFIGSGINRDVSLLGRPLKLLGGDLLLIERCTRRLY